MELPTFDQLPKDLHDALETINQYGLLGVGCCHITGEHDRRHFVDGRSVCTFQCAYAFMLLRHLAGYVNPRPEIAEPSPEFCGYCQRHELDKPIPVLPPDPNRKAWDHRALAPTLITVERLTRL